MKSVILFDIDGTLIDADGSGRVAMEKTLREDFGVVGADATVPMSGRTDTAIIADVLAKNGVSDEAGFREAYVGRLAEVIPTRASRVLTGAEEAVRATAAAGVTVGVLTGNLRAAADVKLGNHDLDEFAAFGAYGDDHADRNDISREAAARLAEQGFEQPANVWIVGDTAADVACARAAGFSVAAVATGGASREVLDAARPDVLLDTLADFGAVLDRIKA